MLDLIIKSWYRQQKWIDDLKLFKLITIVLFMIGLFITNSVFYIVLSFDNKLESFVFLNIFAMILTQYNLPNIQEELKVEKIKSFSYFNNFFKYISFCIFKKNSLIILFIFVSIINIIISLFTNPINIFFILYLIFIQMNLILSRFAEKKTKLILIFLSTIYPTLIFFKISLLNIITCLLNMILYKFTLLNIFLYNASTKNYSDIKSTYSKDNFIFYILTFLKRIKKSEYIEIAFSSLLGMILYKFLGIKYLSYFLIIFFVTKLQLVIENKQLSYKQSYLQSSFYNILNVSTNKKILYSTEMKILFLELITLILTFLFILIYSGPSTYIVIWIINLLLLMYLNVSKYMKVFYYYLDNKFYFKGLGINLVLLYIILININFDSILSYFQITNLSLLSIELLKLFFSIICILIKFEKIFMSKTFRGYNEQNF